MLLLVVASSVGAVLLLLLLVETKYTRDSLQMKNKTGVLFLFNVAA